MPFSTENKRKLLSGVPMFAGLAPRELEALVGVARTTHLEARDQLFHKGDAGSQIYVVIRGTLKALTTSAEGDDVVFGIFGSGEVLGEIALLGSPHRTATVAAISECDLLMIDRRDFMAFLRSHPDVAIELLSVIAGRLKRVSELVEDTLFLNLPVRLAKKLMIYAGTYGEEEGATIRINLKLSQEEWGDLVGATRESINKQLRAWVEMGLVEIDHGYIVIRRLSELEKLAGVVVV